MNESGRKGPAKAAAYACNHPACAKPIFGPHYLGHVEGDPRTPLACTIRCADAVAKRLGNEGRKVSRWLRKDPTHAAL